VKTACDSEPEVPEPDEEDASLGGVLGIGRTLLLASGGVLSGRRRGGTYGETLPDRHEEWRECQARDDSRSEQCGGVVTDGFTHRLEPEQDEREFAALREDERELDRASLREARHARREADREDLRDDEADENARE